MELQINISLRAGNIELITLRGKIGPNSVEKLKGEISSTLASRSSGLIISLKDVTYISISGLGLFVSMLRMFRSSGKDIKLYGAGTEVTDALAAARIASYDKPMVFDPIYNSEEEAIEAF